MDDTFKPELLIGKKIRFQCQDESVSPFILEFGDIITHIKANKRSWNYIGRADLVTYQEKNYNEHILEYMIIKSLIDTGIFVGRFGLKYEIVID